MIVVEVMDVDGDVGAIRSVFRRAKSFPAEWNEPRISNKLDTIFNHPLLLLLHLLPFYDISTLWLPFR